MPVRLTSQRDDHFLVLGAESTCNEFLRVVSIDVLDLLWQRLSLLLAVNVVDGEFSLVPRRAPLTDRYVLFAFRESHMRDGLSVIGT